MLDIKPIAEFCAGLIELVGIFLIAGLAFLALAIAAFHLVRGVETQEIYRTARLRLGHGILMGLEFLVAADIVHTVAVELTFETVGVLAIVVLIRTFLSFTLGVELTGKWPWQEKEKEHVL